MMSMEKIADERDAKMFKMFCDIEEKRRELEREHELKMHEMMLNMIERIMTPAPFNSTLSSLLSVIIKFKTMKLNHYCYLFT